MNPSLTILTALLCSVWGVPLNHKKVVVAINCGSSSVSLPALDGFRYQPDTRYVEGDSHEADYTLSESLSDADVRYTFERDVYMYERHTYSQMTYRLPVRQGFNTIILKFAEMYFDTNGKRVFDVLLGKRIIFKDLDIHSEVGKLSADDKYIEVEIDNGRCLYRGENIPGALADGKLVLQFVKGRADNPIVQGIIVYNSPLSESNYDEYINLRAKWLQHKEMQRARREEQEMREIIILQKKHEKIIIRNDQQDLEEEEVDDGKPEVNQAAKRGFLRELLMSPLGVLIEGVFICWGTIFLIQNVFLMRDRSTAMDPKTN